MAIAWAGVAAELAVAYDVRFDDAPILHHLFGIGMRLVKPVWGDVEDGVEGHLEIILPGQFHQLIQIIKDHAVVQAMGPAPLDPQLYRIHTQPAHIPQIISPAGAVGGWSPVILCAKEEGARSIHKGPDFG